MSSRSFTTPPSQCFYTRSHHGAQVLARAGWQPIHGDNLMKRALSALAAIAFAFFLNSALAQNDGKPGRAKNLPYPNVTDTTHATERVANIIEGFFTAKSLHQAAAMVSFFAPAPQPVLYIDAGLGFTWPSQASLLAI